QDENEVMNYLALPELDFEADPVVCTPYECEKYILKSKLLGRICF
ncbi:8188_t:CDS:2, partial [Gigaspora rosea]